MQTLTQVTLGGFVVFKPSAREWFVVSPAGDSATVRESHAGWMTGFRWAVRAVIAAESFAEEDAERNAYAAAFEALDAFA